MGPKNKIYSMRKTTKLKIALAALLMQVSPHLSAQGVSFEWAKSIGSIYSDFGTAVTVDASGNVYTTGSFQGTVDFDPGAGISNLTAVGGEDIFISKVDAAGNFIWAKQIGGNGTDQGNAIALDHAGNVYITGQFEDTVDFDPGTGVTNMISAGFTDIFITKLDTAGNLVWAKQMGGPGTDGANGISIDASGNVYTTGVFSIIADFDPGVNVFDLTALGGSDIFVSKLDSSGNFVWAKQMGGPSTDQANGIAVDAAGNVYTVGAFTDSADFDPGSNTYEFYTTPYYLPDIFVSKLDASGNFVWAKQLGGLQSDNGSSIAVDTMGNVYTTGYFYSKADFNPGTDTFYLTSAGANDIFVSKLDNSGNFVWAKQMGGTLGDQGSSISLDLAGNVFLTGYFTGTATFGSGTSLTSAGQADVFVTKLNGGGNFIWTKQLGGDGYDQGYSVHVDASGSVYTIGNYEDTADFDPSTATYNLMSIGAQDIFTQKMYCVDTTSSSLQIATCDSPYTLNGQMYTLSGTYTQKLPNASGCDSTITVHLTITPVVAVVTANGDVLSTTQTYNSYQWYLNGSVVNGATSSTYTAATSGNYTVVVTNANGCMDTSGVYTLALEGVYNVNAIAQQIKVYPSPATDVINIVAPVNVDVTLLSIEGKTLNRVNDATTIDIKSLAAGIYLLRIMDKDGQLLSIERFVKN